MVDCRPRWKCRHLVIRNLLALGAEVHPELRQFEHGNPVLGADHPIGGQ
jgi:hypothetical protein